ncbi:MAG: hypothetical protein OEU32_13005 [Acidimicrobiia bacterium]|nr:hypothetical protein [Acidimicrobiia bacterium]
MQGIRHPVSRDLYEIDDDDHSLVRVTAADGASGRFTIGGTFVDGDVRWADPHLCGWVMTTVMETRYAAPADQS